ncbi:MAG: TonB-dependent receptor [Thermoflavifilum sp.]|nr:TonB-dependent receptor [Thermoflavifilum sp.]
MKYLLGLYFWFLASQASAQFVITGRVIDTAQHPLAGATIRMFTSSNHQFLQGTISQADGTFQLHISKPGSYIVQVSSVGYDTYQRTLQINAHQQLQVVLRTANLLVSPLEIVATRAASNAPFTKDNISGQALNRNNLGEDMPYLLGLQPSVTTTSDAGTGIGYTGIRIRGTDATRINVTINGIPVNDAEDQGVYWVDIPDLASSASSIQIQRGVGSSTNGAGAFGATINISTNEYHDQPYASWESSAGSFNTWKNTVKLGTGLLNHHFAVDARLSKISSDGYIDRAFADLKSFYLSGAYYANKTAIRFNIISGKERTYQAWNGVPQDSLATHRTYNGLGLMPDGNYYSNQTDNYQQDYYQLFFNHAINHQLNYSLAAFLTKGKGYYEEYQMDQAYASYGLPDPIIGQDTIRTTDLIRDLWLDNNFYGFIFSFNHTGKLNWTLGGGADQYDGKHFGNVQWAQYAIPKDYQYYYNIAHKKDANLFWKTDRSLTERLSAYLDLQYRFVQYHINGFDDNPTLIQHNNYHFFNPKIGVNWQFNQHARLYVSYAVAHKEPNRDDYEANQAETPRPEILYDAELGYEGQTSRYSWHAGLYFMNYHDQLVLTGKINDVGAYTRTNVPSSYRAGMELTGGYRLTSWLNLQANLTYSQNKIRHFTEYIDDYDQGNQKAIDHGTTDIAFSPNWIGAGIVQIKPIRHLEIDWTAKYTGLQYLDNTSNPNRVLPAYMVHNLVFNYQLVPRWAQQIQLKFIIENLLNKKYANNGYTYSYIENGQLHTENYYFPQAGIHVLGGFEFDF